MSLEATEKHCVAMLKWGYADNVHQLQIMGGWLGVKLPMGRNRDVSQRAAGSSHMIIVTITPVTYFAGQRCLTQLWVYILAGGPFVATFITTSYKAETHRMWK